MPELARSGLEPSPSSKRRGDLQSGWHVAATSVFGDRKPNSSWSPLTVQKQFLTYSERGDHLAIEQLLRDKRALINVNWRHEDNGDTALMRAARSHDENMVRLLLMHGADVTLRNNARQQAIEVTSFSIQELLLCPNKDKLFAHAAWQGDAKVVKEMLRRTPGDDIVNSEGRPALLLLAESPRVFAKLEKALLSNYRPAAVVQQLASHRSDMSVCDEDGRSALHLAVESNNDYALSIAVALVDSGFDTDTRDKLSRTPLHTAASCGHTGMMEMLLHRGANVNAVDEQGSSALHHSALGGHTEACSLLLEQGANPAHRDQEGQCAYDLASSPSLHKRLKQAWQESSTVAESDSRLWLGRLDVEASAAGGDGVSDSPAHSDDSIADETVENIDEHYSSGDETELRYKPSLFITEKSPRTLLGSHPNRRQSPTAVEDWQHDTGREGSAPGVGATEPGDSTRVVSAETPASASHDRGARHALSGKGRSPLGKAADGDDAPQDSAPQQHGQQHTDQAYNSANTGTGDISHRQGAHAASMKPSSADSQTQQPNSADSPKKRRRKVRKQLSKPPPGPSKTTPAQGKLLTSRTSKTQPASDQKGNRRTSGNKTERRAAPPAGIGKKSSSSGQLEVPSARERTSMDKSVTNTRRAPPRKSASMGQTEHNSSEHSKTGSPSSTTPQRPAHIRFKSIAPTDFTLNTSSPGHQNPGIHQQQQHQQQQHYLDSPQGNTAHVLGANHITLGLQNGRRDSLPVINSSNRSRHKSATQRDTASQGIPSTVLEISFDDQKKPVVTKWNHDANYLRQRAQAVDTDAAQQVDGQTRKRPTVGGSTTSRQGAAAREDNGHNVVLPSLGNRANPAAVATAVPAGGSSSDDGTPPARVRSKTLGQHTSTSSLVSSQLALISSRSSLHERSPKAHRLNVGCVELPHIDTGGARLDGHRHRKSSDGLLRQATTRNSTAMDRSPHHSDHRQAHAQDLTPVEYRHNSAAAPLLTKSNSSLGSSGSSNHVNSGGLFRPVQTEEIFVTAKNVQSFVDALEENGLSSEALLSAAAAMTPSRRPGTLPPVAAGNPTTPRGTDESDELLVLPNIQVSPSTEDLASAGAVAAGNDDSKRSPAPEAHGTPEGLSSRAASELAPGALLPDGSLDQARLLQALRDAQRTPNHADISALDSSSPSPVQVFSSNDETSNPNTRSVRPPHSHDDDAVPVATPHDRHGNSDVAAVGTVREDYSPVMTAYIGSASRPQSQASMLLPVSRASSRLLGSRPSTATRSLATMSQSTLSSSNFSALLDDDAIDDETLVFRKGRLLGSGGFGRVYMCMLNNGQTIALKEMELNSDQTTAEEEFMTVQEEVNTLRSLDHVNIVKYIGAALVEGSSDNFKVRIFMELIAGGSIADFVKHSILPIRVCRVYTQQILYAVEYLHELAVVHRDIKGANIMVTTQGIIKLVDFGAAKRHLNERDLTDQLKGTPYWMAPEVFRHGVCDKPVDIWSVGCTVFEMVIGHHPWFGYEVHAAMYRIGSHCLPDELSTVDLHPVVKDFIIRCMTMSGDLLPYFRHNGEEYSEEDPAKRPTATQLLRSHKFLQFQNRPTGVLPRIGRDSLPEKLPSSRAQWKSPEERR